MRLIVSLLGLIAIVLAVAWFGYGLPPKAVYYKTVNMLSSATSTAGNGAANVSNATSILVYKAESGITSYPHI